MNRGIYCWYLYTKIITLILQNHTRHEFIFSIDTGRKLFGHDTFTV